MIFWEEIVGLLLENWDKVIIVMGLLMLLVLFEVVFVKSGEDVFVFFDVIVFIVYFESVDLDKVWFQLCYDKVGLGGIGKDYLNCLLDKD